MATTAYGDISPRTAAYAQKELLKRGEPYLVLERFGQGKPVPDRSSKVTKFRRYEALDATPSALSEGVTPSSSTLTHTDITATLQQYGDLVTISDVVMDTHEDPVLAEANEILGEQAAQMIEKVRFNVLKAGTNVHYANGAARGEVNTVVTRDLQRRVLRSMKRQNARAITKVVRSTPSYGTENVAPAFIALTHPDLEGDIRNMSGFKPAEDYGALSPYPNELGAVEGVRYLTSTVFEQWEDAGATADPATTGSNTLLSTTGTASDVYPILYIGANAYGIVPLKGKGAITPMVVNPKPSDSDPLAQRGHASWKAMQTAVILNDLWMARLEVAASV
jgi:N4-gp56 family major capsid protein